MGARFGRSWVFGATVAAAAAVVLMLGGAAEAATPSLAISSPGPLSNVWIGSDLSCQVQHTGDDFYELYGQDEAPGDCGTFLATGGTLYAPDFAHHDYTFTGGLGTYTPFTAVSQSPSVLGSGTSGDPYRIVTVADVGTTGLRITQTDSYVVGQEAYRTDVQIANSGGKAQSVTLYRAGDCYLGGSDSGFGVVGSPTGAVACVTSTTPGSRIEQWAPLTSGSHYLETYPRALWTAIAGQGDLPDTCDCSTNEDNSAGLSWALSVPAGGSLTVSNLTNFSPAGHLPLTTTKTADQSGVSASSRDGYTITLVNPNSSGVQVTSISDTLPAGFAYAPGSTTGATTSNPTISGQTLTWTGPFADPAAGSLSVHFDVTASSTPGTYFNNATADAAGFSVVPTGDTAPVTVTAPVTHTLTSSKGGSGSGSVTSSPAGISCGATCSASFNDGTMVTLTASADAGSTFTGWSGGGCSGTGTCVVTLNADTTVTATFTAQVVNHTLTVSRAGSGTGSVTSSPAGISCGGTCSTSFANGTVVTLTATADAGSTFAGWSGGGCSGSGTCVVTLNADTTATATFTAQTATAKGHQAGWWKTHDDDTSALLPVKIGNYTVSNLTASSAVFAANNCGSSKEDGVGCLAAELLAAKLNVKAGSDPCIASSISAADAFLVGVGYTGPGSYTLSDAQRSQALSLKNDLQHYDGSGNC
jgi:uncharacterized repeat protein (TIGR01451 family)